MSTLPARWAYCISAAAGGLGWLAVASLSHRREAWDSPLYFAGLLPVLAAVAAVLGFLTPTRPWRWGVVPFATQALIAFLFNPSANLFPLGLALFAFFGLLCTLPAQLGAAFRRRSERGRETNLPPRY